MRSSPGSGDLTLTRACTHEGEQTLQTARFQAPLNTLPILLQLPWIQLRRRAWQPGGAAAYALIVGVAHLEGMQIRVSISLVLKLSKSGSGVWAPFPLSLDHNGSLVSPKHTKAPKPPM